MVLELMLIGVAVALDPLPLTAFLVVLPSRRGARKGFIADSLYLILIA